MIKSGGIHGYEEYGGYVGGKSVVDICTQFFFITHITVGIKYAAEKGIARYIIEG